MSNFFNLENPFFTTLSKICDMIFLSIVYVIICIPIVTIGPATTALYYTTVKVIRRDRSYLFREFFKSFKLNFKKGALAGIILTIISAILAFDVMYAYELAKTDYNKGSLFMGMFIAIIFIITCITLYIFPVLSRFEIGLKQLFKTSFFMSIRHLPSTILMIVILLVTLLAIYLIQILAFILPSVCALLISFLMERIFKKYMPKSEDNDEDAVKDEWYLE